MTNTTRLETLDEVLANYAQASQEFDAKVLQNFINTYSEYAQELRRYAYVQLISVAASPEEIEKESIDEAKMLQQQSKLLQQMQRLQELPSSPDADIASAKLAAISGEQNIHSATISVLGSCDHGEDLLLLSITDTTSRVSGVPAWFYNKLGEYLEVAREALIAALAMKQQPEISLQRFSAKRKPTELISISWEQLVEDCITDDAVKNELLKRSK